MPRPRRKTLLTFERANDLLRYNPHTGSLTWRRDRGSNAKAGDEAGTVTKDRVVMVGIDGQTYTAARVAWLLHRGKTPSSRVRFLNGDTQDLRFDNLVLENENTLSLSNSARYQRRRRAERKAVDALIAKDTDLQYRYAKAPTPEDAKEVYDEALYRVRLTNLNHYGKYGDPYAR